VWVDPIVSNNIWIQFESLATIVVVFSICTVACSRIGGVNLVHVHILVYHGICSVGRVDHIARKKSTFIQICPRTRNTDRFLCGRVELDHHGAIHFCPVHIVYTLHIHQVLICALHHHLSVSILALIHMLMEWNVLKMVLVLLLAAESQLGALIQLVSISLSWNIHHDEVFTQLILVCVIHPHRIVVHLTIILHSLDDRCILGMNAGSTDCETHKLLSVLIIFGTLLF